MRTLASYLLAAALAVSSSLAVGLAAGCNKDAKSSPDQAKTAAPLPPGATTPPPPATPPTLPVPPRCAEAAAHITALMRGSAQMQQASPSDQQMAEKMLVEIEKQVAQECASEQWEETKTSCIENTKTPEELERCVKKDPDVPVAPNPRATPEPKK